MTHKTMILAAAAAALLGTAGPADAQRRGPPDISKEQAERAYAKAREYEKQKDYREAVNSYAYAANKRPKDAKYQVAACVAAGKYEAWSKIDEYCKQALPLVRGTADEKRVRAALRVKAAAIADHDLERARSYAEDGDFLKAVGYVAPVAKSMNRPSDWLYLCELQVAADRIADAKGSCAKVKGKLAAKAKKVMIAAKNKPTPEQLAALVKVNEKADAINGRISDRTGQCLELIAAARKLGAKDEHLVPLATNFKGYEQQKMVIPNPRGRGMVERRGLSLAKVESFCRNAHAKKLAGPAMDGLSDAQLRLNKLKKGTKELTEANLIYLQSPIKKCRDGVAAALKAGAEPSLVLEIEGVQVKLGEAKVKVCDALEAGVTAAKEAYAAKQKAELEAVLAPFKKVLKKGKLEQFIYYRGWDDDMVIQGKGGYRLVSPADFKKARKWFMWSESTDRRGRPIWEMRVVTFRGNKHVKTKEKRGRGSEPPRRAFR